MASEMSTRVKEKFYFVMASPQMTFGQLVTQLGKVLMTLLQMMKAIQLQRNGSKYCVNILITTLPRLRFVLL